MTDYESIKAEFAFALQRIVSERKSDSEHNILDDWIEVLSLTRIASFNFSFSPDELLDYYSDDEIVFSKTFYFYDGAYLRHCCSPGDDCLAGKYCIPIGGVDGADEILYISDNLKLGIALLHRSDVFSSLDLDAKVAEKASHLKISLLEFVEVLAPLTNLVKFTASCDASKWSILENLGTRVRYRINLSKNWDEGERSFESSSEAAAFFFMLIQQCRDTTNLSISNCPENLRPQVEEILNS